MSEFNPVSYIMGAKSGGSGGGGGGGGGGPLFVHFTYDEDNDNYPGDATASQVHAACLTYGFAIGVYDNETISPFVITGIKTGSDYYFSLGMFYGDAMFREFSRFSPTKIPSTPYSADEYICGYYDDVG